MKFLYFIVLSFLFSRSVVHGTNTRYYVSLGRDCQIASSLVDFNMRRFALPFDWVLSSPFEGVIKAFEEDFEHFLDPLYLSYETNYIANNYYGFGFSHFFPMIGVPITEDICVAGTVVDNYLDYLPAVQTTQERRIQRLKDLLSSEEVVFFIRTHINKDEAVHFVSMLNEKYPQLVFILVMVHERADLIDNWHLEKVINYYASLRRGIGDWWNYSEWQHIINDLRDSRVIRKMILRQKIRLRR